MLVSIQSSLPSDLPLLTEPRTEFLRDCVGLLSSGLTGYQHTRAKGTEVLGQREELSGTEVLTHGALAGGSVQGHGPDKARHVCSETLS